MDYLHNKSGYNCRNDYWVHRDQFLYLLFYRYFSEQFFHCKLHSL